MDEELFDIDELDTFEDDGMFVPYNDDTYYGVNIWMWQED